MTIINPVSPVDVAYTAYTEEVAAEIEVLRRLVANYDRGIVGASDVVWRVSRVHWALQLSVACFEDACCS